MEVGIDIVDICRFENMQSKKSLINKIYTKEEQKILEAVNYKDSKCAGIFCVKEAFLKALGCGINGTILLNEIEVYYSKLGKPYLRLLNNKMEILNNLKFKNITISISHTNNIAEAICILGK